MPFLTFVRALQDPDMFKGPDALQGPDLFKRPEPLHGPELFRGPEALQGPDPFKGQEARQGPDLSKKNPLLGFKSPAGMRNVFEKESVAWPGA
jgi:hypothetical protein